MQARGDTMKTKRIIPRRRAALGPFWRDEDVRELGEDGNGRLNFRGREESDRILTFRRIRRTTSGFWGTAVIVDLNLLTSFSPMLANVDKLSVTVLDPIDAGRVSRGEESKMAGEFSETFETR